jgi:hypothetical protein
MSSKTVNTETRPTCVNHGCNKPVHNSGKRYRPLCYHCHTAGYKNTPLKAGVTAFRTGKCNNQDGRLGFTCPIDYSKTDWVFGITQIDHIDGNHLNNTFENCQELCDLCHKEKGRRSGDFKNQNRYFYK